MTAFIEDIVAPLLGKSISSGQRRGMLVVPRGCLKTTLASMALPIWLLAQRPNLRILIDTHKHEFSKEILYNIKWYFEQCENLHALIGDVSDHAPRWSEDSIIVNTRSRSLKEPSVGTSGVDLAKTGGHYDLIVMDDIVSEINVQGERGRRAVSRHFRNLIPVLEPLGSHLLIGTRFSAQDLFGELLEQDERRVTQGYPKQFSRKLIRSCYLAGGELYFPSILTTDVLAQLRLDLGDLFSSYYLNEPIEEANRTFTNIQFFRGAFNYERDRSVIDVDGRGREEVRVTVAIDPATTKTERSDFTGIVVIASSASTHYVLDAIAFKGTPEEVVEKAASIARIYKPDIFSIEANAAQALFIPLLSPLLSRLGVRITPYTPGRMGKDLRIQSLQPLVSRGVLLLREGLHELDRQMRNYSTAIPLVHDDLLDALAQGITQAQGPRGMLYQAPARRLTFWERLGQPFIDPLTELAVPRILDGTQTGHHRTCVRRT